ncbi:MAG: amino acid transporter [Acidobacteria bacterium]|nr:MAG: amino acid transporter [Acidobacteriota bacterium]
MTTQSQTGARPHLARQLGLFDATMIVMGGIIGAGIFVNSYDVAQQVHTPVLILGAWLAGGMIALAGAFIYAELAARLPGTGGQYVYLREAFHPSVAFIYGWALLLVTQTGGMAAVAIIFARHFRELTHVPLSDSVVAGLALALLTIINCFGVRAGSNVQSGLMVIKILTIVLLIICGLLFVRQSAPLLQPALDRPPSLSLLTAMGAALTPVMFAYGGWQTASFVAGEMRNPRRDLARGLLIGVCGVIALYVGVSFVCVRALSANGLAQTPTPASAVMRLAWGERGAAIIACGIAISTLGFLSQGMLTAPRVYFAMAADKLFFKSVARLSRSTHVPFVAIALQGACAIIIAFSGRYDQILHYVVSVDFIWFGLTGVALFVFRRRASASASSASSEAGFEFAGPNDGRGAAQITQSAAPEFRVPGHPFTTLCFVAACWLIVISTINKYPRNSMIGLLIMLAGLPVYYFWRWWRRA